MTEADRKALESIRIGVVGIAKEQLDILLPADPNAVGRAKEWQDERESLIQHLDFFTRTDASSRTPLFIRRNASRVIDILVALGMPYADALAIWEVLRQGTSYDASASTN